MNVYVEDRDDNHHDRDNSHHDRDDNHHDRDVNHHDRDVNHHDRDDNDYYFLVLHVMILGAISRTMAQTLMHPANTYKTLLQMKGEY